MAINNRRKFKCLDCGIDTSRANELYMLVDNTWMLTGLGPEGMLCIEHVEARIGRELSSVDFNNSYLNNFRTNPKSMRLISRMTR